MNEQSMNVCNTPSVTESATDSVQKISKEELQLFSDEKLLELVQRSIGHTGKDFSDYMGCDFSYSHLTGLLKSRGYINGWYKVSDQHHDTSEPVIINMRKSGDETVRQSYLIEKSIAEDWKSFNQSIPFKTVTLSWALRMFMDAVKNGKIKFELELF